MIDYADSFVDFSLYYYADVGYVLFTWTNRREFSYSTSTNSRSCPMYSDVSGRFKSQHWFSYYLWPFDFKLYPVEGIAPYVDDCSFSCMNTRLH
jgi:hypothetical protein